MNLEEIAAVQSRIQGWVIPEVFVDIAYSAAGKDFIENWLFSNFSHVIDNAGNINISTLLMEQIDPSLAGIRGMLSTYAVLDFSRLRTESWMDLATDSSLQMKSMFHPLPTVFGKASAEQLFLSSMKINPEKEKRDAELFRILAPLHEKLNSEALEEYKEIQSTDAVQIIKKISDYATSRRHKYAWACILSDDELKNGLANCMIGAYTSIRYVSHLTEKYAHAINDARKDTASRDRRISEYVEEIKRLKEKGPVNPDAQLRADYEKLLERAKELEARPVTIVPADVAQLQKQLDSAKEYEVLFSASEEENKRLRERVASLEGQLAGIQAQAQQRREHENSAYESFALYATREGYDADLAAAILRTNAHFRSNNMVPRSMMRKNAENALEDKSKIRDFDKTLRWLTGLGAYNQKGDAFSTNVKFSDIPVNDIRAYVSLLVGREA